jgi:hypothetical protein
MPAETDSSNLPQLVVPSTSVKYNEEKERKLEQEAKQKRLQVTEPTQKIA